MKIANKIRRSAAVCRDPQRSWRTALIGCVLWPTWLPAAGLPTSASEDIEEVIVTGAATLLGDPTSATQGLVTGEQLMQRPVARAAELLEFMPGLIATQHSGEGKANQYFLRGFNLDHGTDFYVEVEGLPVNMRSHGHGQGYADLNFLITPLVDQLEYRKGPYYADIGDFSAAGSADFRYPQRLQHTRADLTVGEDSYVDVFLAGSPAAGDADLVLALAHTSNAGPFERDQNLRKTNGMFKYTRGGDYNRFSVTGMLYDGQWDSSDQVPKRAVERGLITDLGFIDPTVGGESHRYSLSAEVRRSAGAGHWNIAGYAIDYALDLFSNFTYLLEDNNNGDQFEQVDERRLYGLSGHYHRPLEWVEVDAALRLGMQVRHDDIDQVGLYSTLEQIRIGTVREDQVSESSVGVYAELDVRWSDTFRSIFGARLDYFDFDVMAGLPANGGSGQDALLSPKLSLVFGPWHETEYFLNIGQGFHSNDARGVTIAVDPGDPAVPAQPVDALVSAWGVDLGLRTAVFDNMQIAAALWGLQIDSELLFVGDGGVTETRGESERYGAEISMYYTLADSFIVDADYAWSHARFAHAQEDHIPGAVENVASVGVTWAGEGRWSGGMRLRFLGDGPLVEDNSVRSQSTTVLNAQVGYDLNQAIHLSLAVYNLLDSDDADITYFYESRLPGEIEGVEDVHFKPVQPSQLRLSLQSRF